MIEIDAIELTNEKNCFSTLKIVRKCHPNIFEIIDGSKAASFTGSPPPWGTELGTEANKNGASYHTDETRLV